MGAKTRFCEIVKNHKVQIIRDDGLYRHLSATNDGSSIYRFDLITWPGHLAYTGDMGSFIFARIPDMFAFFRGKDINPGYWAEKVLAENVHDGIRKFSVDAFREAVLRDTQAWLGLDDEDEIPQEIMLTIGILLSQDDEHSCIEAMNTFQAKEIRFINFFEHDLTEYTPAYIFACHAIVWAIAQYDARGVER